MPVRPHPAVAVLVPVLVIGLAGCTASPPEGATTTSGATTSASPTATPGPTATASATDPTEPLAAAVVAAVVARLSVMPQAAAATAATGQPVRDPARERAVVRAFVARTTAAGVPRRTARAVIRDQLAAAVNVQRGLLDAWAAGTLAPPPGPAPDLATEVRPQIDAATADLAAGLTAAWAVGIPAGWGSDVAAAQGAALPDLPEGVTAVDLALALSTVSEL